MRSFRRYVRQAVTGATPIALFMLGTVVLAGWLGYQALDAAVSHRRTAEAVLSDYARISATEMARIVDRGMDDVLDEVFEPVSIRRLRQRGEPSPELLQREMRSAMRDQNCACPGFSEPVALFRISRTTGEAEVLPDTLSPEILNRVATRVLSQELTGYRSAGLLTLGDDDLTRHLAVGYSLASDPSDGIDTAFGFIVTLDALGELFETWYADESLLPDPVSGGQPNDSLLHVTITDPHGQTVFSSPVGFPTPLSATTLVRGEYGALMVRAAVRPEAASQLVIGGLPRSRLPLLTTLLLLTLGVGSAAAVQLRREQAFQRLRDDFVSGVSHELRTPLAQIRMFAELQQDGKLLSERDRTRAISVIHRESVRLSHLVENILQFSRLQRMPEYHLPREQLDLVEVVTEGVSAVAPLLDDRGMALDVSMKPDVTVVANREALMRIVVNLLDNAAKYGPRGQTVRVTVDQVNGSARLAVSDEGPGIPAEDRERVWKPYHRLDRDIRAQIPGTGIGLSVVSELAALSGGRTWIEEAESVGARFVVELPLTAGAGLPEPGLAS